MFPRCGGLLVGAARQAWWSKTSLTPPPVGLEWRRSKRQGPQDSSWHPALPPSSPHTPLPDTKSQASKQLSWSPGPPSLCPTLMWWRAPPQSDRRPTLRSPQAPPSPRAHAGAQQTGCPSTHLQRREHEAPAQGPRPQSWFPSLTRSLLHSNPPILGQVRSWPWGSAKTTATKPAHGGSRSIREPFRLQETHQVTKAAGNLGDKGDTSQGQGSRNEDLGWARDKQSEREGVLNTGPVTRAEGEPQHQGHPAHARGMAGF